MVLSCQFEALLKRRRYLMMSVCFVVTESVKTGGRPLLTTLQVPPKSCAFSIFSSRKKIHQLPDAPMTWKRSKSDGINSLDTKVGWDRHLEAAVAIQSGYLIEKQNPVRIPSVKQHKGTRACATSLIWPNLDLDSRYGTGILF